MTRAYGSGTYGSGTYDELKPLPYVKVEVAFTTDPDDPNPAWVDLDAAGLVVKGVTVKFGRAYEQDQVQPGIATVTVDNSKGDFTPGNTLGRYFPSVTTDRRLRITVTPPGSFTGTLLFDGTIERWPVDMGGGFDAGGDSVVTAVDGSDFLSAQELFSAYAHEVLADAPLAYYPLTEAAGSTSAGQLSTTLLPSGMVAAPAALAYGGAGGGASQYGGTAVVPSDPGTSLVLAPHTVVGQGNSTDGGVQLRPDSVPGQAPFLTVAGGFTVEWVGAVDPTVLPGGAVLCDQWSGTTLDFRVLLTSALGIELLFPSIPTGHYQVSGGKNIVDGQVHHCVVTLAADGRTVTAWMDGVLAANNGFANPDILAQVPVFPGTTGMMFGSGAHPGSDSLRAWYGGRLGHVALYQRALSAADVARHWAAFAGFPGELPGARAARVLTYAGWKGGRALDTGATPMGPLQSAGQAPLALLQSVAKAEQGLFYLPGGAATLQSRAPRVNPASRVTLTAGSATLPVEPDLTFELDRTHLLNDVLASRPGTTAAAGGGVSQGTTIRVRDQASITRHRRRNVSITYEVQDDDSLRQIATWDVLKHREPTPRAPHATVDPLTAPALWPWVLGLRLSDRITIAGLPATAPQSVMDFLVESYELVIVAAAQPTARCTWLLSPADSTPYLTLDDPVYGGLDQNALAY